MKRHRTFAARILSSGALFALASGTAHAQSQQTGDSTLPVPNSLPATQTPDQAAATTIANRNAGGEEIVVTGTLIRGIAPAGNNVVGLTTEQIAATGGTSTNQILNNLPQIGNFFNGLPAGVSPQSGANLSNPVSRPNLRNLPAANTSGGAQTLVLFDGHRVVGAGIQQIAVDPDILAPGVIERVEALTDGGSAVYGSDALGGVLNLITRRKFNGVQVSGRYGFGSDYYSIDSSAMIGRDWGSGGLYVAYGYAHRNAVYGTDRDFVRQIDWNTGVPTGRNCPAPTATVGAGAAARTYVVSGAGIVAGPANACDLSDNQAIYPTSTLHNVYSKLVQDLSDSITIDVTALYASRKIEGNGGSLGTGALGSGAAAQATLTAASPNYRNPGGAQAGQAETVRFDYSPLYGPRSATQRTLLETYSVTPSISFDLGSDFQLRALASYGRSSVTGRNAQISSVAQATALANSTLNPFAVEATSPAVASLLRQTQFSRGRNELFDYRAILDGPLFSIGGGEVRAAIGAERMQTNFNLTTTAITVNPYRRLTALNYTQKVNSAFGELQIPFVSRDNEMPGLRELTLSASARYDDYNDVGNTFNPKVGGTYRPVSWIAIRGNIGKSFNAPTPVDQLNVLSTTVNPVPSAFLTAVGQFNPVAGETGVFVGGTDPNLQPQKATNWSVGTEIKPPFVEGLTLSASYYHIDLKGTIGRPVNGADLTSFFAGFPSLFQVRPSGQQLAAYLAQFNPANVNVGVANPTSAAQALITSGGTTSPVLVLLDTRASNLGRTKLSGIDFAANYLLQTGFGSIDASFAGNYKLKQDTVTEPGRQALDDLFLQSTPKLLFQATLGATIGKFRAQAILNHTAGYTRGDAFLLTAAGTATTTPNSAAFGQTHVKAFDAINLFFRYEAPDSLVGPGLEFTVNVQNLLSENPSVYKSASFPGYNTTGSQAFSIGRIVQLGVSKKF